MRRARPGAIGALADPSAGLRFRVPLDLSVPRLLTRAGYRVATGGSTRSTRELFDTGDRRLAAAGGELSLEPRGAWRWRRDTLGHPKLSPREWTAPADDARQKVDAWTRAYHRGRPLDGRATVTVHTRRHQVSSVTAEPLLTVVEQRLDERTAAGVARRLRHLEVTDATTAAADAIGVLRGTALDDGPALALLRPRLVRAPRLALPSVDSTDTPQLFTRSATLALIQWLYYDCELPAGTPEALRKLRIALRRLRSDLQAFAPLLDRAWADGLRDELGGLGTRLGLVRDGEVRVERLDSLVATLPDSEQAAAVPLLDVARAQVAAARAELLEELQRRDYLTVIDHAVAAVTSPRWREGAKDAGPARLARRPWRRLRSYVEAHQQAPDASQLHRIRILAKRARYAADMCVPAAGGPATHAAAQLAALQTVLGEHHDAVVTREWLQRESEAVAGVSFVAGELAALELRRIHQAEKEWRAAWDRASRAENWRWLHN